MEKQEEKKVNLLGKLKQSDQGVKLAVAVGVGVAAGVTATLAVQAYGKKRENDALRLQGPAPVESQPQRNVTILRLPAMGQQ